MILTISTLIIIAIILFIVSFFMQDRFKQIEDQLEQFSISSLQESYQMKKKLKILEEELLTSDIEQESMIAKSNQQTPVIRKINELHEQGYDTTYIAKEMGLNEYDVKAVIHQF
ncbi:hypothetical protein [Saliterribacillus persicus]|uniref:Resolvase HTH domain-containing protein n=1 Tax=Saliterribacillus persicus TaxID=930114 RepID=A0A368XFV9_9BACI|nr:hypothetical protein [Saliterribacillus persicus]RCW65367.1 hypothetical protein DFR57_111102 [Saliterribacillus persicus]